MSVEKTVDVTIRPVPVVDRARLLASLTPLDRYFGPGAVKVKAYGIALRPSTARLRLALKDRAGLTRADRNRCYGWLAYRRRQARRWTS